MMSQNNDDKKISKRKLQAINTHKKIYNTAFRLISEKGFDNITVDEICQESGVSKGSFYHHFNSKDDIVIETYKIVDQQYSDEVSSLPEEISSIEKIIATVGFQATFAQKRGVAFVRQIYKSQLESGTDFFILESRPFFNTLKIIIEEGIKKHELKKDLNARETARWIVSFSRGITYDWCLHNGNYDIEKIMKKVFRSILKTFELKK